MSTSLLYHAFGIRGYDYVRTEYQDGQVIFTIAQDPEDCRCPACGSRDVISRGHAERRFLNVPIGSRPTAVVLPIPRVECRGLRRRPPGQGPLRRPQEQLHPLLRALRPGAVPPHDHQGRGPAPGRRLGHDQGHPEARPVAALRQAQAQHLRAIAIDEIAVGKGHRYLTVVLDLVSGAVVFVGDGKGVDALKPFWKRLRPSGAKIEAVATDMSAGLQSAVRANLPKAVIVFDHFHVVKLFNDKLSDLRRQLYREATDVQHKAVLKGTRWLLLKNAENLDPEKDEKSGWRRR